MSHASRRRASLLIVAGGVASVVLAPSAAADPDIHVESATSVIEQFQKQGYAVDVNGAPAGDTSLLSTCTVTSIRHGDPTTVFVTVACPIMHG